MPQCHLDNWFSHSVAVLYLEPSAVLKLQLLTADINAVCLISQSDWSSLILLSDTLICVHLVLFVYWSMIKWDCTCDPIRFSYCTCDAVGIQQLTIGWMIIKDKAYRQQMVLNLSSVPFRQWDTVLYQAFEKSNDYVLIRKQTGCGRAGTAEGEVLWTQRDCRALWKGHARRLCATVKDSTWHKDKASDPTLSDCPDTPRSA